MINRIKKGIDLAVLNAAVWTGNQLMPAAEAVGMCAGKIVFVGTTADLRDLCGPDTNIFDAGGRRVVPGFNDAHLHLEQGGRMMRSLDLRPARDEQDFVRLLAAHMKNIPPGRWVTGGNWDHEAWPGGKLPGRRLIDALTPDNPVLLRRVDGHAALANSLALEMAGIRRETPDPPAGRIVRDPHGEATGMLVNQAQAPFQNLIPEPDEEDIAASLDDAMQHCLACGLTSVQGPMPESVFRIVQRMHRQGRLKIRVYAWSCIETLDSLCQSGIEAPIGDDMLRFGAVKFFVDGSFGAGSALLFEPYDDDPDNCGITHYDEQALGEMVCRADAARLQIVAHAIGDQAVCRILNALAQAVTVNGKRDSRHRIEHAQLVRPQDLERFAELGVLASIQPSHATDDMRWIERRIGARVAHSYPFKSLVDAGAGIALGSDWPCEPPDPVRALHAAVTREACGGGPPGGWIPQEKVSVEHALAAATNGSAHAEFQDHAKGILAPGYLADMVVLSRDPLRAPPSEIMETQVDATILGGRVVCER